MSDYTFAVGTRDPEPITATGDEAAVAAAVTAVLARDAETLRSHPEEVVVLMGPDGLLTRPSERIDEFVRRKVETGLTGPVETVKPGDSNTPDCNGD